MDNFDENYGAHLLNGLQVLWQVSFSFTKAFIDSFEPFYPLRSKFPKVTVFH